MSVARHLRRSVWSPAPGCECLGGDTLAAESLMVLQATVLCGELLLAEAACAGRGRARRGGCARVEVLVGDLIAPVDSSGLRRAVRGLGLLACLGVERNRGVAAPRPTLRQFRMNVSRSSLYCGNLFSSDSVLCT